MTTRFLFFALGAILCLAALAGGQVNPGTPSFGTYDRDPSGHTTVNLQNLNVMLNVPVMSKPGAFPFRLALTPYPSYIALIGSQFQPGYEITDQVPTAAV